MNLKQRQTTPVERTYAEALFGAARSMGVLQRVQEEAKVLLKVVQQNRSLLTFLESPHVKIEEKMGLLDRVFKGRLSPVMINLLHVLATRRRTTYLDEILEHFQELVEQAEGIYQATVTSAWELNFQDKLKLKTALERHTQSRLKIDYAVDPAVLGGVIFRFRDLLIDGSLRGGLHSLRERLLGTQLIRERA